MKTKKNEEEDEKNAFNGNELKKKKRMKLYAF